VDLHDLIPFFIRHILESSSSLKSSTATILMKDSRLIPQNTSIINQNSDSSERIHSALDDSSAVSGRRAVHNRLSTSLELWARKLVNSWKNPENNVPFVIWSTTFCAAAALKSFTTTLAPLEAKRREYLKFQVQQINS
jgi:hypothetical protein